MELTGSQLACIALPLELARRSSLSRLRSLSAQVGGPRTAAAIWAAPWVMQLTRLKLSHTRDVRGILAGVPRSGLDLPMLRSLEFHSAVTPPTLRLARQKRASWPPAGCRR